MIILLVSLFCAVEISAQQSFDYPFRHISQPDGLMHNEVLSVAQDGKGFIWLASRSGLQRYDGETFVYYPDMLSNPLEGANFGATMYADKKTNSLWITNSNTLLEKLDLANYHFTTYNADKLIADTSIIFGRYRDKKNIEWPLTSNGVYRTDSLTKKNYLQRLNIFPAEAHQSAYFATDATSNYTWITPGTDLLLFDKKNNQVYSRNFNPNHHPLLELTSRGFPDIGARFVMIDSRQNIWLTTWGEILYRYNPFTKK